VRVLVIDDEENVRRGLATFLGLSGYEAEPVGDLASARAALGRAGRAEGPFLAVLADVCLGAEDGSSLIAGEGGAESPAGRVPVVMMSGRAAVRDALAALKRGAYDFLEKPLDTDRLLALLRNLEREAAARRRVDALRDTWLEEHLFAAPGSPFAAVVEEAGRIAASPLSVLVSGPTGSGKELVARWIHLSSPRSQGPFVAVNCSAIPAELAESALFGHRKGSFTGAAADASGYFEAASGGTLFLDEVGEIALPLQAKLLRAAESGEIQPVGGARSERADARIVAATNRDLFAEAKSGRFREDLLWRLAQATLRLPSLAERRGEIRALAAFLAEPIRSRIGPDAPRVGEAALDFLEAREWPGNVRELRAALERALWLAPRGKELGPGDLAPGAARGRAEAGGATAAAAPREGSVGAAAERGDRAAAEAAGPVAVGAGMSLAEAKSAFERAYVERALEEAGGSVARAAEALGLRPNNLSRKLRELGVRG
jgi:two-component system, NtrC family, nitrogen regulation response regulator NtrX